MKSLKLLSCYDDEASKSIFKLQGEGWEKLRNELTLLYLLILAGYAFMVPPGGQVAVVWWGSHTI